MIILGDKPNGIEYFGILFIYVFDISFFIMDESYSSKISIFMFDKVSISNSSFDNIGCFISLSFFFDIPHTIILSIKGIFIL